MSRTGAAPARIDLADPGFWQFPPSRAAGGARATSAGPEHERPALGAARRRGGKRPARGTRAAAPAFAEWSTQLGSALAEVITPGVRARTEQAVCGLREAISALKEILRYEPVVGSMGRVPREDLEVEGVKLGAGQSVMLSLVAANRDPARFEDPDRFDVRRAGQRSLAFGWGAHHCLGAALARAELQEVPCALTRCRRFEPEIERPRWVPFTFVRKLESLPVIYGWEG